MASSPYNSLNGANYIVVEVVVLCNQITLRNSLTHFLFGSFVMFFLIPAKMMPFALSTAPLDCG
jgi:hypothetical protein